MIQGIKDNIWKSLQKKEISLAIIYNVRGQILWSKGRAVLGKTVFDGSGFSKTPIFESLKKKDYISTENGKAEYYGDGLSETAVILNIKSTIIHPIDKELFLYLDSGSKEYFTDQDIIAFELLGEILGDIISRIRCSEEDANGICGSSVASKKIRKLILNYSFLDESVLLLGETGVGKSHIASLLHQYSGRLGKLVVVNIPAVTNTLFESVLFGHTQGAYTDAKTANRGLVQEAEGGTLFIDEIAEIPIDVQSKLLRFIETKMYRVVGEPFERSADVRIVASTNKNLKKAIDDGEFRKDLYYRLQVLEMEIPPLRHRKEDIKKFVKEKGKYLRKKKIGPGFWDALARHDWPGNFRELITVLKRAGLGLSDPITGSDIVNIISSADQHNDYIYASSQNCEQIWQYIKSGKNFWDAVKKPYLNRDISRREVKEIIEKAFVEKGDKYSEILNTFNLKKNEYKKFTNFLMVHKIMK